MTSIFSFRRIGLLTPLLWSVAALSLAAAAYSTAKLLSARNANRDIAALAAHEDIDVKTASAPPQLALAKLNELLRRDRFDEAQAFANATLPQLDVKTRSAALYNLANAQLRRALAAIGKGDLDTAASLTNLAKAGYRASLRLDPGNWDARNNLDVAQRVVRDLPVSEGDDKQSPKNKRTIWTDLPGAPKGLP